MSLSNTPPRESNFVSRKLYVVYWHTWALLYQVLALSVLWWELECTWCAV